MGQEYSTYVANGCDEAIYACVTGDRAYLIQSEAGIKQGLSAKGVGINHEQNLRANFQWDFAEHHGFTKIAANDYLEFQPHVDRNELFVSIVTASGHWVASCFPIPVGQNVTVDSEKNLRRANCQNIWFDKDHRSQFIMKDH